MKLLSFNKFNENIESSYVNDSIESDQETEFPVIVNLELEIHRDVVDRVQNIINEKGLNCSPTELLHDYFLYNSGYDFDETLGHLLDKWLGDNIDNYS